MKQQCTKWAALVKVMVSFKAIWTKRLRDQPDTVVIEIICITTTFTMLKRSVHERCELRLHLYWIFGPGSFNKWRTPLCKMFIVLLKCPDEIQEHKHFIEWRGLFRSRMMSRWIAWGNKQTERGERGGERTVKRPRRLESWRFLLFYSTFASIAHSLTLLSYLRLRCWCEPGFHRRV